MNLSCIFAVLVPVWGSVVVLATYRRWSILVDPPTGLLWGLIFIDFQWMKRRYGERFTVTYIYLIGMGMMVFGLATASFWFRRFC